MANLVVALTWNSLPCGTRFFFLSRRRSRRRRAYRLASKRHSQPSPFVRRQKLQDILASCTGARAVLSHGLSPRKLCSVSRFSGPLPVHLDECIPECQNTPRDGDGWLAEAPVPERDHVFLLRYSLRLTEIRWYVEWSGVPGDIRCLDPIT